MYKTKNASTNQQNKMRALSQCPVTFTLERIGGRWKALILYQLYTGEKRYGELRKAIAGITEKMLVQQLRELEADKLVVRTAMAVVPPYVTYSLSEAGQDLAPVMTAMANWGMTYSTNEAFTMRAMAGCEAVIDTHA